jgi:hypothetical protein
VKKIFIPTILNRPDITHTAPPSTLILSSR